MSPPGCVSNTTGILSGSQLPHTCANQTTLNNILTISFTIIGAIAFLVLVIAGLRYILAQGDPNRVAEARNQIVYSLIGLIIAASAVAIVNFLLGKI